MKVNATIDTDDVDSSCNLRDLDGVCVCGTAGPHDLTRCLLNMATDIHRLTRRIENLEKQVFVQAVEEEDASCM